MDTGFVFLITCFVCVCTVTIADVGNETCYVQISSVDMSKLCQKTISITNPTEVTITSHGYSVIDKCLNCSVTMTTKEEDLITASLVYLGTETDSSKACDLVRLDVFDGPVVNMSRLLSDSAGICGCSFPSNSTFKTTGNSITIRLQTTCNSSSTLHGQIKMILASVKNELFNKSECRGEFTCDDGKCLDKNLVCDGHADCLDKSDETNCTVRNGTCPGQFECNDGQCVDKNLVCNGKKNCPDGSDESGCHGHHGNVTCPGKFECLHGRCIDKNKVCDGKNDCGDNSDEIHCHRNHLLMYILIGIAGLILLVFIIILIVVCCKNCCVTWRGIRYKPLS